MNFPLEIFKQMYAEYRWNPVRFVRETLHKDPTDDQLVILEAYTRALKGPKEQKERFMSVKSGQGGGKTACETWIALHWCFHEFGARMRILGVSIDQLKDTWMAEIRQMMDDAEPWFQAIVTVRTRDVLFGGDPDWGIKLVPAKDTTKVAGRHHPHLAFIVDEVSGVPRDIIETVENTLSNADRFFGLFGNPNYRDTYQFDTFHSLRDSWWTYTINCETSRIADPARHARVAEIYGKDSDVYRIRVKGEFPSKDPEAVMSSEDVEACMTLEQKARTFELIQMGGAEAAMGIDLARKGNDQSTIFRRCGNAVVEVDKFAKMEPVEVIDRAFDMQREALWSDEDVMYIPDADGMGQGCMFKFEHKRHFEFRTNKLASNPMYANAITEAYFEFAKLVRTRSVYLPHDNQLIQELSTRNYGHDAKGRLILESKKEWRRRIQKVASPDSADGCVLAFYKRGEIGARVLTDFSGASKAATPKGSIERWSGDRGESTGVAISGGRALPGVQRALRYSIARSFRR